MDIQAQEEASFNLFNISHVSEARCRLDDVLNDIAERSEENYEDNIVKPVTTPSKRSYSSRGSRKRKKKPLSYEDFGDLSRQSYIIKLFDRSVDLAQFEPDASLYVMMRAWMRNKPFSDYKISESKQIDLDETIQSEQKVPQQEDTFLNEDMDEDIDAGIYNLPLPTKVEGANYPRPLPPALKMHKLENIIDTVGDMAELKKENMIRWRKVKQRWRDHSFKTQERYQGSLVTFKQMFNPPTG